MMYNNIIYATEQDARSYLLPTSTQMLFMDPSAPVFYVKSTDAFGIPSFEAYTFEARTPQTEATQSDPSTPITRADLDALRQELIALLPAQPSQPQEDTNNG